MPAPSEPAPAAKPAAANRFAGVVGSDRDDVLADIDLGALPGLSQRRDGKVRVGYATPTGDLLFVTTDRLSAFDRVLACVPYKGQVLNELSAWWFAQTRDLVANHVVAVPDPNVTIARVGDALPIEVIVRGYITGVTDTSMWSMYAGGDREPYGHHLPEGLHKNDRLPTPLITPTTKADTGGHDEPLTCAAVTTDNYLDAVLWDEVQEVALALFDRAATRGLEAGLILADTKYEFGLDTEGNLMLIDEVHTPDSSRWWVADTYAERRTAGLEPESLDKEVVRRAYADLGYTGNGPTPDVADEVWSATSLRYIDAFERITGQPFVGGEQPAADRVHDAVRVWLASAAASPTSAASDSAPKSTLH